MIFEILCLLLALIALLLWIQQIRPAKYPPGPLSLPILGHLHLLDELPQKTLMVWQKKYGPIFQCDFGSFRGVVLGDYKLIKEAFSLPAFAGRPKIRAFSERSGGTTKGLIFTEGHQWMEQRRFSLRHLRDFGFGKQSQESLIHDEVVEMIEKLKAEAGQAVSTQNRFNTAILNALWTMIAGVRHSQDDEKLRTILALTTETMADPSIAALFMPWLTKLAPDLSGWKHFMSDIAPTQKFLQIFVEEHKKTQVKEESRDFIDVYLDQIENTSDPNSSFYKETGEMSLKVTLMDFVFASVETSSHTLAFITLYLAVKENRHLQKELHEEIDRVVGRSRFPSLADRPNLPFVEATILEAMRLSSVIPLGVWHSTTEDIHDFHGFNIPKDTMIVSNLYAIHHDESIYEQPDVFKPQRFLSADGKSIVKPEEFIPFSIGKRVCIGEKLAADELFLMFSAIIQNFGIETVPGEKEPSLEPVAGPVSSPKPHKLIFHLRE